jgi:hypothetical protein
MNSSTGSYNKQMMKLTKIICRIGLVATIAIATRAGAIQPSILGSYKSNGYTIDLEASGNYHSCNPQNRCFTISRTKSSQQGKTRIWQTAGYTYQVTPLGNVLKQGHHTRISVKIIDPKFKVISNRIFRYQ